MKNWQIDRLREQYPKGTQVELHAMSGEPQMPCGLMGSVDFVDDAGQIHCSWQNGSTLALVPGEDSFSKFTPPEPNISETKSEMGMNMQ